MELADLARAITNLPKASHAEKIKAFAWHIHTYRKQDRFDQADIRACYDRLDFAKPENVSPYFQQLQRKKPPDLLKDKRGYRLEGRVRQAYDAKYGTRLPTIVVDAMLTELAGKVPNDAERLYLVEAIACFRIKAFRAAIVMTWNVAYDHFEEWIIRNHLTAFNTQIAGNYPRKSGVAVTKKEDFNDHFKEAEVIEISKSAGFLPGSVKKIMSEKLSRRNLAAHPSSVEMIQYQAEDTISDLVNNVILKLI